MESAREALGAAAHFITIFAAVAALGAEIALYRRTMSARSIRRLRRVDVCYGIAAGAIVATGLLRVFLFGKGVDYYAANIVFWTKMVVFTAIGLLSIRPTIHFVRTERDAAPGGTIIIASDTYRRTVTLLWTQAGLFAIVPLLAALMARGIG